MSENGTGHDKATENARADQLEVVSAGTHLALAQSLKASAEAQQGDHEGWAVISRRAEAFVRAAGLGVTRLLFQPDLRLRDPAVDEDLQVLACRVEEDASVKVSTMGRESHVARTHDLAEMHVAGPVNDAVRATVAAMMQTLVEDSIGQAVEAGQLGGVATFDKLHQLATVVGMTPEELVDQHWQQLQVATQGMPDAYEARFISREALADAMLAAAVNAVGGLPDEDTLQPDPMRELEPAFTVATRADGAVEVRGPFPGGGFVEQPDGSLEKLPGGVDHLQAHASYRMEGGRCVPDEDPDVGVCSLCTKPLHLCACVDTVSSP